jgi:hypothetical protein
MSLASPVATVRRDGSRCRIDATQLVPGDIVLLEAGDRVPADLRLLEALVDRFDGGPVGISTLATVLSEEQATIEDAVEPFLLRCGLLQRTPRGRIATAGAYRHLGRIAPSQDSGPLALFGGPDEQQG